jgi:hypothetical protein
MGKEQYTINRKDMIRQSYVFVFLIYIFIITVKFKMKGKTVGKAQNKKRIERPGLT